MFKVVKKFTPMFLIKILARFRNIFSNPYEATSYSQEGEDMILRRVFEGKTIGFYVDIGAHHPVRFSNTFYFYKQGWTGVNVEPNPESHNLFKKQRPKDININCGIARKNGILKYHMFAESALNTFNDGVLKSRIKNTAYKHMKTIEMPVFRLDGVIEQNISENQEIDFLSVDVEGLDLEVLQSNNWEKFRPSWVLVEQLSLGNIENLDFEMHQYMKSVGYVLFAKTFNTLFYKEIRA